jgi:hypothetical protein
VWVQSFIADVIIASERRSGVSASQATGETFFGDPIAGLTRQTASSGDFVLQDGTLYYLKSGFCLPNTK